MSTESLHIGIDTTGARPGADQFTPLINRIGRAVDTLDRKTECAYVVENCV